jgi:hypothetical protein
MKSKRKFAKELLKIVKNNDNYNPFDYDYQRDEEFAVCSDKEIINALCDRFTKPELKSLQHKDTTISIYGWYDGGIYIGNETVGLIKTTLIYLGRLKRADTPTFI